MPPLAPQPLDLGNSQPCLDLLALRPALLGPHLLSILPLQPSRGL